MSEKDKVLKQAAQTGGVAMSRAVKVVNAPPIPNAGKPQREKIVSGFKVIY